MSELNIYNIIFSVNDVWKIVIFHPDLRNVWPSTTTTDIVHVHFRCRFFTWLRLTILITLVSTSRRRRIVKCMCWSVEIDSRYRLSGIINVFDRRNLTSNLVRCYNSWGLGQFLNRNVSYLWNKTNVKEKSFSVRKIQKRKLHVIILNNIFLKNIRSHCDASIRVRL